MPRFIVTSSALALTATLFASPPASAEIRTFAVPIAHSKLAIVPWANRTRSQRAAEAQFSARRSRVLELQSAALHRPKGKAPVTLEDLIVDADGSETGYQLNLGAANAGAQLDSGGFPDLQAFDFNAGALYPGAIVRGDPKFVEVGQLATDPLPRGPGTVTLNDVAFTSGAQSAHVATASEPEIQQAVANLTRQHYAPDQAGSTDCSYSDVYSSAQASYEAHASFGYLGMASLSDTFKSADDHTSNHVMVFCRQEYFTASFIPDATTTSAGLDAFFAPGTSLQLAQHYIAPGSPPLFVSSVTYGSELIMMADSKYSSSDIQNTISASFNAVTAGVSGSGSFSLEEKAVASSLSVKALAIGGRASGQYAALTQLPSGDLADGLVNYLKATLNIASGSGQSQEIAVPISYSLSYLDFTPVQEVATIYGQTYAASPAHLRLAKVHFHQNGDGKDWDTEVDLMLKDANKAIVAQTHLGKNTPFPDNSDTPDFTLVPTQNPPISKDLLQSGSFDIIIHPNGHDTWHYTAYVTLYFDDGSTETGQVSNTVDQDYTGRTAMLSGFVH